MEQTEVSERNEATVFAMNQELMRMLQQMLRDEREFGTTNVERIMSFLHCSRKKVYSLIKSGKLKAFRLGIKDPWIIPVFDNLKTFMLMAGINIESRLLREKVAFFLRTGDSTGKYAGHEEQIVNLLRAPGRD